MSNAFTSFLSGLLGTDADLKDYQHADRLYVRNTYARAPKLNFLYFVSFNINPDAILDKAWEQTGRKDVGLLVKRVDLPRFSITNDVLNQYNRKTVVQTKLTYANVSLEFHDDNSDITNDLWKNYYQYYYADSTYESTSNGKTKSQMFGDTKYGDKDYAYGFNNYQSVPFFNSIDIYILHKGHGPNDFTQITLLNPLISEWAHDSLNQDENGKPMSSKMTIAYEGVAYNYGKIVSGSTPEGFAPVYYDTAPSPLGIAGMIPSTLFGSNGIIAGAGAIFGENGSLANANSPLALLGVGLQTANLAKGVKNYAKNGSIRNEAYSILGGVLSEVRATGNQPGGVSAAVTTALSSNNGGLGNIGVNLYSSQNSSINGKTKAVQKNITKGKP